MHMFPVSQLSWGEITQHLQHEMKDTTSAEIVSEEKPCP